MAVTEFSASKALRPAPTTSYNLAAALYELGRLAEAYAQLQGLRWPTGSSADARTRAEALAARLDARIAHLTVNLTGSDPQLRVWLDGTQIPDTQRGVQSVIAPGPYTLRVQRGDTLLLTRPLQIEPRAHTVVDVCLVPAPGAPALAKEGPALVPSTHEEPRLLLRKSWQFWTVLGAVVVASGAAITIVATHHSDSHGSSNAANPITPLRW